MKILILQYLKYNLWANTIIANLITEKALDLLDKEIPNSFPTLRKTLLHIWDAENIWLTRLNNLPVTDWPSKDVSKHANVLLNLIKQSEDFIAYVESQEETWLNTNCTYINIKGETFSQPVYTIILHCMNHSTFHRGQIICMMRQLGFENLPSTDLITFSRNF
ncbi:MAG: DinB family protein [Bacteroidia bacterium]